MGQVESEMEAAPTGETLRALERFVVATKSVATPKEYGEYRGVSVQTVYTWLRSGRIKSRTCECGRKIVDIAVADKALDSE